MIRREIRLVVNVKMV